MEGPGDAAEAPPPLSNGISTPSDKGKLPNESDITGSAPEVVEGYDSLIDEYGILSNSLQSQFHTVDIVNPVESEEEKKAFIQRNRELSDLVALLSTRQGCKEWIRRKMLRMESAFLSSDCLRIFASTWNVNGKKPLLELNQWLADEANCAAPPDVYMLAFQEVQPLSGLSVMANDDSRGAAWKEAAEHAVSKVGNYFTVGSKQMIGLFLIVLVKEKHRPFVHNVSLMEAGTGFMRTGGNKGGVSCRFVLYDKRICCVSSHLAAHDHNVERRNQDFHDVIRKTSFQIESPTKSPFSYRDPGATAGNVNPSTGSYAETTTGILEHDVVFWLGDLNYRIELPLEKVVNFIADCNWMELAKADQLINAMESGEVFQGFEEQRLCFKPTYKHDAFRDTYEMDEEDKYLKRKPAWTDRVLWRDRIRSSTRTAGTDTAPFNNRTSTQSCGLRASAYRRHEIFSSDHRPVSATFHIDVDIIHAAKRNKTVEDIHMNLRKRQNLLRPRLSMSSMVVDFGRVEFLKPADAPRPVIVRNLGHVPISISIQEGDFPRWLQVGDGGKGMAFTLTPFEERSIRFRAHVQPGFGVSSKLNMGIEKLTTGVPLSIHGKSDAFITIVGDYQKTCFGNTVSYLAAHPKPFSPAATPTNDLVRAQTLGALPVPKEIYTLISYLVEGCAAGKSVSSKSKKDTSNISLDTCTGPTNRELFLEECSDSDIQDIRRRLDAGQKIPDGTAVSAVASCVIALLESQEEPLIPYNCYEPCIALVLQGKFSLADLELILHRAKAKAPVYNTIVYLCAFLSELPGMKVPCEGREAGGMPQPCFDPSMIEEGSYFGRVLSLFTKVLLRPPVETDFADAEENSQADWSERMSFMGTLLLLCGAGTLEAIFDYSP